MSNTIVEKTDEKESLAVWKEAVWKECVAAWMEDVHERSLCQQSFWQHYLHANSVTIDRNRLALIVKSLSSSREDGTINDEEFTKLITHICSVFIENEVQKRLTQVFAENLKKVFEKAGR